MKLACFKTKEKSIEGYPDPIVLKDNDNNVLRRLRYRTVIAQCELLGALLDCIVPGFGHRPSDDD